MGRSVSSLLTPSHRPHSRKKQAKQTARQLREAQQKSLSFHSRRLCHHADWDYLRTREVLFPIQREAEPAKDAILALKNNPSYSQSGVIQTYGKANLGNGICTCCAKVFAKGGTRTWKGCVSFPVGLRYPDRAEGTAPFLGQCANCHWGGQGYKCSIRIGGVRVPPRRFKADLFQSKSLANTHLGSKHDLDTSHGCMCARQELQGVINQLNLRVQKLQQRRSLDRVQEERPRYKGGHNDDQGYIGSSSTQSSSRAISTRRSFKIERPSTPASALRKVDTKLDNMDHDGDVYDGPFDDESSNGPTITRSTKKATPTSYRSHQPAKSMPFTPSPTTGNTPEKFVGGNDDSDYYDEEDYCGSVNAKTISQAPTTRRDRQVSESSNSPSPRVIDLFHSDDDDEYIGPANMHSVARTTFKRTRSSPRQSHHTQETRVQVVLPAFQPSRERSGSPSFHSGGGWY